MTPGSRCSVDTTLRTGSVDLRARMEWRWLRRVGSRCWAMTMGARKPVGSVLTSVESASMPPAEAPMTTSCRASSGTADSVVKLSPLVNRNCFRITGAVNSPVTVRFATHHRHADFVDGKDRDELVVRYLQVGRQRLFAEGGAWIHVILDQLVVPELAGAHAGLLVRPLGQRSLRLERAALFEETGGDRVEHEERRLDRIHAQQHVAHVVPPVTVAHAEREGGMPARAEQADRTVSRLETPFHVEGLPRRRLFVFGDGQVGKRIAVALRAHVRLARHRAALQILRQQAIRA